MRRTHLSLIYLAGYVTPSGLSLFFAPELTVKMLLSTGQYSPVIVRMVGVPLFVLGIFVIQVIRHKLEPMYPTTLVARVVICSALVALYLMSSDPMFLVLLGIVGFGFVLTLSCFLLDRRDAARAKT